MLTRRMVLAFSASLTALGTMTGLPALTSPLCPLKDTRRPLRLGLHADQKGRLIIASDAPPALQPLILPEVVDQVFGVGTHDTLTQPDHWRMIEAGLFSGEALYTPTDQDEACHTWHAYHKPTSEAYEALIALFEEGIGSFCGLRVPEFGLSFVEHPCTPRLALAILDDEAAIPRLTRAITARDDSITLDLRRRPALQI